MFKNEQLYQPTNQPTNQPLPRKQKPKLLIKLFSLFLLLFLVSNCAEELEFQDETLQKGSLLKNDLSQKQRLIELAEGINLKISDYNNQYRKPQKFQRKYGKLDTDNFKIISFPKFGDDLLIVIPFKNKKEGYKNKSKKTKKLFIAFYKNSKKTYTVISNKNYKKKLRSSTEEGFITHLEILFDYVYNIQILNKTTVNKMVNCWWMTTLVDQTNCTAVQINSCTGEGRVVSIGEKGGCGDLDEIILYADPSDDSGGGADQCPDGYIRDGNGVCVPETDNTVDDSDTGECDEMDYDCDKKGGRNEDDQQTDKLNTNNLNTTQKQLLDQAVINLQNDCLGKVLYNSINTVVNIEVGQTTSFATYTGISNTIRFNTNNDIDAGSLGSELFHAYQQQIYGTLDDIETDSNIEGGSNMEFEEKAFNMLRDIENNGLIEIWGGTELLKEWLINLDVVHGGGNINLSEVELNEWFKALKSFRDYQISIGCKDHYCDPIDYSLKPEAIIKLINIINSSNCN